MKTYVTPPMAAWSGILRAFVNRWSVRARAKSSTVSSRGRPATYLATRLNQKPKEIPCPKTTNPAIT